MPYRPLVDELCDFLDGDTDTDRPPLDTEMRRGRRGPGVRAGGPAARPAGHRPPGDRAAADGRRPPRGHRRHRHRRRRAGGVGAGVLRPQGPGGRAQGLHVDKVEDAHSRAGWSTGSSRASTARTRRRACPSRCSCRSSRTTWRRTRSGWRAARLAGRGAGAPAAATSGRCSRPSPATPRRSSPGTGCAGRATTTRRSRALTELQEHLGLPEAPLRIECYDMAHLQGTDYVGSMVVLEDGLPNKREYRRFKVTCRATTTTRRWRRCSPAGSPRYLAEQDRPPPSGASGRASSPTRRSCSSSTAARASSPWPSGWCDDLGLDGEIPVAALAKRFEEVYVPGRSDPVEIPRGSEALFMLQRIRDEAHRFANTFHRERRSKRMTASALDGIAGLGETPQEAPGQGARRRHRGEAGEPRGAGGAVLAARRRSPPRSTPSSTRDAVPTRGRRSLGAPRHVVDRRVHRGRRPGVRRSRSCPSPRPSCRRRGGCSTSAAARARSAGSPPARRRRAGRRRRPDVEPDHGRRARGAARPVRAGRRRPAAVRRRAFDAVVACLVFEHVDAVDAAIAEVARVLRPAGGSASSSTTRCCRRPAAGGSTTRCSTRRSSTGGSART